MNRPSRAVRDHLEWLGFIQPTGLVVSAHALEQAGAILNQREIEGHKRLRAAVSEGNPDFEHFARTILGWNFSPKGYAGGAAAPIPHHLEHHLPDYGETLRPDFAVRDPSPSNGASPWQLLVQTIDPATGLDQRNRKASGFDASPHDRLVRLLRETRVTAGLLFNRRTIRLVSAPRGETTGWMDFRIADMRPVAGRPLFAALRMLLSQQRLLALPADQRLAHLLEASRKYQNIVSERLSEQVLHGLHELLRGFQAAHKQSGGALLAHELEQDPDNVYRALLTVILRLVFLLYAEERGMLPDDETFVDHYSVVGLHERLREDAGLNPDTMDERYGAWAQLLVLFRMVHDGARSGNMHLPPRRGGLFSPSRFPFLEGWRGSGAPQIGQAIDPPLVPDGTIHRVLEKLLVLDGERISYRALDVEQIGSVYETMMGFRLERATGRSVAVKATKRGGASTVIDLDALLKEEPGKRATWVRKRTDRPLTPTVSKPVRAATTVTELHSALARVVDGAATPDLVPRGAMILQPGDERRSSGSRYTPRELTAPIVERTLRPVFGRLRDDGDRRAPRPDQILDLKVCDPAMGSGAFLVETCRFLGEKLVEAWKLHGGAPALQVGDDLEVIARRMVAQRCLYGVDRNPMAVDLAKVSLWLATLAKDEPLTFVDHALRDGDSLVGLTREQIAAFTWRTGTLPPQLELNTRVGDAVKEVRRLRRAIREAGRDVPHWELEDAMGGVEDALRAVRFYGDLAIEAFFAARTVRARKLVRDGYLQDLITDGAEDAHRERLALKRKDSPPFAPFHWEMEFPEVFERERPGFDAVVGNPPFAGKNTVAAGNVLRYPLWLKALHPGSHGNADLVAHFFRRTFGLLRDEGALGLIATNTIGQGDTRTSGLRWICTHGGEIFAADRRFKWPGEAAVVVSVVHVFKGRYRGARQLDRSEVDHVTAFLFDAGGHDSPAKLEANADQSFQGTIVLGMGFTFDDTDKKGIASPLSEMRRLLRDDPRNGEVILPYVGGKELNTSPTHKHHRYVINFQNWPLERADLGPRAKWHGASRRRRNGWLRDGVVPEDYPYKVAADWPEVLGIVRERVKPARAHLTRNAIGQRRAKLWWRYGSSAPELYATVRHSGLHRALAISRVGQHCVFTFLPTDTVFAETLIIFPLPTHAAFCALQSRPHEIWARFFGSSMKDDLRYTPSDIFETFPFPDDWTTHPDLETAGKAYYEYRADLMVRNNEGLTKTYNRFRDPHETAPEIVRLRELHVAMDRAVLDTYGWTDIPTNCDFILDYEIDEETWGRKKKPYRYRWPDPVRDEVLGRLMQLNAERAEEERGEAESEVP